MFQRQIIDRYGQDPARIRCFFPEETNKSWKKCEATEFQDPVRIRNKIFKDPDKFTIAFESGFSQETDRSWKKCEATEV